jgi:hypothetical protein
MVILTLSQLSGPQPSEHLSGFVTEKQLGRFIKGDSQTDQSEKERHADTITGVDIPALHVWATPYRALYRHHPC